MRVLAKEADVEAEGCSEGEKGESCPPAMGVHSLVTGKDMPGATSGVWLCSLPLGFHSRPGLKSFPPFSLFHKAYLKGLCL